MLPQKLLVFCLILSTICNQGFLRKIKAKPRSPDELGRIRNISRSSSRPLCACYVVYAPVCQNQNQTNVFDGIREPSTTTSSGNNTQSWYDGGTARQQAYSVHASGFTTWCSRSSQPAPRSRPRDVCCCCWEVRQCYSVHSGVDSVRKSTAKFFSQFSRTNVFCLLWVFFHVKFKKVLRIGINFRKIRR